jgi:hypothetical protein
VPYIIIKSILIAVRNFRFNFEVVWRVGKKVKIFEQRVIFRLESKHALRRTAELQQYVTQDVYFGCIIKYTVKTTKSNLEVKHDCVRLKSC